MGKNQSVGKSHTKWLGGPGCGPRVACCTPLLYCVTNFELGWTWNKVAVVENAKHFDLPSFTALFDLDFHNQNNSDINITCNNFILMFNNILDQHAPRRFGSRIENRSFHKPWLTKGLLTSISKKNALYKKMLPTNYPSISAKYKFYRNKITHLKESLKQNYDRSKFENCRNDVKKPGKLLMKLFLHKQKKAK